MQIKSQDFLDYADSSKYYLEFNRVPFTKISSITLSQVYGEVKFSEVHGSNEITLNIKPVTPSRPKKRLKRKKGPTRDSEPRINQCLRYRHQNPLALQSKTYEQSKVETFEINAALHATTRPRILQGHSKVNNMMFMV